MTFRTRALLMTAALLASCSGAGGGSPPGSTSTAPSATTSTQPSGSAPPAQDVAALSEGPITPGTYVVMPPAAGWAECMDGVDCSPAPPHERSLQIEVTIPAGWEAGAESTVITLAPPGSSEGPDGAGLVMGWYAIGLHSDPCRPVPHSTPDTLIGPTVADFVDAVEAHPSLEVSEAADIELGGYSGQFFTLTVPSDIGDCVDWRPWEHGIFAQGPDNIWNVWVVDVDGLRMIVLAEEFPATSAEDIGELRAMVESIRFVPSP